MQESKADHKGKVAGIRSGGQGNGGDVTTKAEKLRSVSDHHYTMVLDYY